MVTKIINIKIETVSDEIQMEHLIFHDTLNEKN